MAVSITVAIISAIPLLLYAPAPLEDWPNHLSRVAILHDMLHGPSAWSAYYQIGTFLLPNVALDVGLLGLMHLGVGIDAASTFFLVLVYGLFISGACLLASAFKAFDPSKILLAVVLFYSNPLFFGFVNYVIGVAFLSLFVAFWLSARNTFVKALFAIAGAVVTFFCHIVSAGVFVAILGCIDLVRIIQSRSHWRPQSANLTSSLAAAVVGLLFCLSPFSSVDYGGSFWVNSGSFGPVIGFLLWKAEQIIRIIGGAGALHDLSIGLGMAVFLVILAMVAAMRMPLTAIAAVGALWLLFAIAPESTGGGSFLDSRLPLIPLMLMVCAARFSWRSWRGRNLAIGTLASLCLVRTITIVQAWEIGHDVLTRYADEVKTLAPGSVIISARGSEFVPWREWWLPPLAAWASFAARQGLFVPSVFADGTQQPLVLKSAYRPFADVMPMYTPAQFSQATDRIHGLCGQIANPVYLLIVYPTPAMQTLPALWSYSHMRLVDACVPLGPL